MCKLGIIALISEAASIRSSPMLNRWRQRNPLQLISLNYEEKYPA